MCDACGVTGFICQKAQRYAATTHYQRDFRRQKKKPQKTDDQPIIISLRMTITPVKLQNRSNVIRIQTNESFHLAKMTKIPAPTNVTVTLFLLNQHKPINYLFLDCSWNKAERLKPTLKHPALDLRVGAATATPRRVLLFGLLRGDEKTGHARAYSAAATC